MVKIYEMKVKRIFYKTKIPGQIGGLTIIEVALTVVFIVI